MLKSTGAMVISFLACCRGFVLPSHERKLFSSLRAVSVNDVLKNPKWPETFPFSPKDFSRQDNSQDKVFYDSPRFVFHIDDAAVKALTNYYSKTFFNGASVLDICSSWVSHFPSEVNLGYTAGIGMNADELKKNPQLKEYTTRDLNLNPIFPYEDNTFDFVTCVVSVDYLTRLIFCAFSRVKHLTFRHF
jgi:hypothetical protein